MDTNTETGGESALGTTKRPGPPQLAKPFVSVIVTNYNYAKFIEECLASILAQTYTNFECVVVDDRSTDGSPEVIRTYLATHPEGHRARLHECTENGGQMAAFIEGFRLSKGTFVVFVDADDWLFPSFLEAHVAAHLNAARPAGISCSDSVLIDAEGGQLTGTDQIFARLAPGERLAPPLATRVHPIAATPEEAGGHALLYVAPNDNPGGPWIWTTTSAIMFRRGILETILSDRVRDIRICADYYLLRFAHLIGGTLLFRRPLGAYRLHGNNNYAATGIVGTGTSRGRPEHAATLAMIRARTLEEVAGRYDIFAATIGAPQAKRLLANLTSVATFWKAVRALTRPRRSSRWRDLPSFLVLFAISQARWLAARMRMRFWFA
ncbi:MAG: glycosyltransferase family A protein [Pseudomonadota bacterium]